MDELYLIMRDLLEVEYNQRSLLRVLETLESAYEEPEQEDVKLIVHHIRGSIKESQAELREAIGRLDSYTAKAA